MEDGNEMNSNSWKEIATSPKNKRNKKTSTQEKKTNIPSNIQQARYVNMQVQIFGKKPKVWKLVFSSFLKEKMHHSWHDFEQVCNFKLNMH